MNKKYELVVPDELFFEDNILFVNDIFFVLLNLG